MAGFKNGGLYLKKKASVPSSGSDHITVYSKNDGKVYAVDENGTERLLDNEVSSEVFDSVQVVVTGITADANYYNSSDGNWYSDSGYTTLASDNTSIIQSTIDAATSGCNVLIPCGNVGVEDTILVDKSLNLLVDANLRVQGGFKPSSLMWYSEGKVRADLIQVRSENVAIYNRGSHFMNQEWAGNYTTGDTVDVIDDASNLSGENGNQIYLNVVSAVGTPVFSGDEITSYSGCDNFTCFGIHAEKTFNGVVVYAVSAFDIENTHTFNSPTHDLNYTNAAVEAKFCDNGTIINTIGEGTEEAIDFNPNARNISVRGVIGIDCTQACVEINNGFGITISDVLAQNCFNSLRIQNYADNRNPDATYQNESIAISNVAINYINGLGITYPGFTNPKGLDIQGCNTVSISNFHINIRNDGGAVNLKHAIHIHNVGTSSAQRRSRRINLDGFIIRCSNVDGLENNGSWVLVEDDADQITMSNGVFELVGIENGQTIVEVSDNGSACDDIQFRDLELRGFSGQTSVTGFATDNNSTVTIIHPTFKDIDTETSLGTNTTYIPLVADHNDLNSIQGGQAGQYFHLTSAEYADYIGSTEVSTLIDSISGDYVNIAGDTMSGDLTLATLAGNAGDMVTLDANGKLINSGIPVEIGLACSDETSDLTTGNAKVTIRAPYAFTLDEVRGSLSTATSGADLIVDVNHNGASIFSSLLTIDAGETTSTTATTSAVISGGSILDDAEITVDIDQVGSATAGTGLKIWLIGER